MRRAVRREAGSAQATGSQDASFGLDVVGGSGETTSRAFGARSTVRVAGSSERLTARESQAAVSGHGD